MQKNYERGAVFSHSPAKYRDIYYYFDLICVKIASKIDWLALYQKAVPSSRTVKQQTGY
jgi:hypothetical protein